MKTLITAALIALASATVGHAQTMSPKEQLISDALVTYSLTTCQATFDTAGAADIIKARTASMKALAVQLGLQDEATYQKTFTPEVLNYLALTAKAYSSTPQLCRGLVAGYIR